jgi:hypothetical protein
VVVAARLLRLCLLALKGVLWLLKGVVLFVVKLNYLLAVKVVVWKRRDLLLMSKLILQKWDQVRLLATAVADPLYPLASLVEL